jgi:putative ABC transport system permease protein
MLTFLLHGWRSWKSAKPIAFLAVFALALGIGSATAIYTVVQTVLLKPFSYKNPDQLYTVFGSWRALGLDWYASLSYQDYLDYSARQTTASAFGCFSGGSYNVVYRNDALHVSGIQLSTAIPPAIGINPRIGRWFLDERHEPAGLHAAVLSDSLWKRLGASEFIVGQLLTVNGKQYTITGVMPAWFRLPPDESHAALWVPLDPDEEQKNNRGYNFLQCVAFKRPGVTEAQLRADMTKIAQSLSREHPNEAFDTARVDRLADMVVREIRPTLLLLLGAAATLLLITCANVGGLLVARSVTRARETALRVAIGAARWQLALQYFAEGLIVSLSGAVLGALLSYSLIRLVIATASEVVPRADEVSIDGGAVGFAFAVAILCGILFSLAPLWQAARIAPNEVLSDGVRASASARSRHLLRVLVVAEIALAFGLLSVGVILFAQLNGLYHTNPGFDVQGLYTASILVPNSRFQTDETRIQIDAKLLRAVRSAPGVESAGFTSLMPLMGWGNNTEIHVEGGAQITKGKPVFVEDRFISPGFFHAMRIPILEGRDFDETDVARKPPDAMSLIINQTAAKMFWRNRDPVGTSVTVDAWDKARWRVIGVVGDTYNAGLAREKRPELYINYLQSSMQRLVWAIRSNLDQGTLDRELSTAVKAADPALPIYNLESMHEVLDASLSQQRLASYMVSFFSLSALLLALLGVYGVVSYSVRQRTTEIGTRMAIGATTQDLLRLVVGDGVKMAAAGIVIGLIAVFVLSHFLADSILNIKINDPAAFLYATLFVITLTMLACFFPAWRATLVSPLIAIRNEPGSMWQHTRFGLWRTAERLSGLISRVTEDYSETGESEALAEITEAARHANSFPEALRAALARLKDQIRAESLALLVQKRPGQPYRCTAVVPDACVDGWILPADALIASRLHNYAGALPITKGDLDATDRWAGAESPETQLLREMGATLVVRAAVKREISGLLFAGRPVGRNAYSTFEKRLVRAVASQLALMIENGRLTDRIVDQERLRRELLLATEVQKRLFPENPPHTASLELAGVCVPARGVGGDYYDFIDLGQHRLGIALADVAGKGIAAALIMSIVQASLRSLAGSDGASLAVLASKMNRLLHRSTGSSSYATFFYAEVDETARKLRYVNAGHNPPYIFHSKLPSMVRFVASDAGIEELPAGGTIIGMFAQSTYEEAVIDLSPGDILMVFTDGVPEALNPKDEEFGEDRLKQMLRRYAHLPVNEMASRILQELKSWISDAAQYDDLTFILMKVL